MLKTRQTGAFAAQGSRSTASARRYATQPGSHIPPGATLSAGGVNFSIFARHAASAELRLYAAADSAEPFQVIALAADLHRTFFFWHVFVEQLPKGTHYTWRVATADQDLAATPELCDPWARAVSDARWDRRAAIAGKALGHSLRAVVSVLDPPAHARDERLESREQTSRALENVVIYEMHVGGFTRHPSAAVRHPGTFAGVIEKIPYLKELGITHVELLPVMAFDEQDVPTSVAERGLKNYWGYSSYGFYAPHPRYCRDPMNAPGEFREMVRALHEAGIDVLLDVVFNHTAEGGASGPTINFKALANDVFYHREPSDPNAYRDFTGCGNTVNCNHPMVANFILRCLEYWASDLGVDGFRFDLASVFSRGVDGTVLEDPALPWSIELSPILVRRPVIAEAWDAAGLNQVGGFPGMRWAEWNGQFRDVLRRFVRGDAGLVGEVATRIAGSEDMYRTRTPLHSVNFITCHDGFTLYDLVSYERKHNEANGEDNRDGNNDNMSWNCGVEGETDEAAIIALRRRQAKNFMAIMFLSQGVPMIRAGDEVLHSQRGNNNAYCQDNELSWFDWRLLESNGDMLRFTRELIALRGRHPSLRRWRFLSGKATPGATLPDIAWHGERLDEPGWHDSSARLLAFTLAGTGAEERALHVILNMSDDVRSVALPPIPGQTWHAALDTALSPSDEGAAHAPKRFNADQPYVTQPRSVVALEAF